MTEPGGSLHVVFGATGAIGGAGALTKLQSPLDEVVVELEHPAVPGVGIEDEVAVGEPPLEVDGVRGGHHLVAHPVIASTGWWMPARSAGFC